jgi:urease accessory protein
MTHTVDHSLIRLLQLCSSSLPVGGYTYSQGIEWAVEKGWIKDDESLKAWLMDLLQTSMLHVEIPALARMHQACISQDLESLNYWCRWLLASRETRELREEETSRGRALASLLVSLEVKHADEYLDVITHCQTAGFALAVTDWRIPLHTAAQGFAWSWLENLVLAGVKLIPLGQTKGQRILSDLAEPLTRMVEKALELDDEELGSSSPALAMASSRHEIQYTRLFRS